MCSGFYACLPSEEPYFGNSFLHYYFVITAHLNHSYQSAAAAAAKLLQSVQPHRWQPTRLPRPWDPPGKNTGVGCHFLFQCMQVKMKSLSHVRLFLTPWTAAHQAPPSMGFSRQEHWSGVPVGGLINGQVHPQRAWAPPGGAGGNGRATFLLDPEHCSWLWDRGTSVHRQMG